MFKIPVCSVIFFNHESPLRSKEYVIKKIIDYLKSNKRKKLKLGNINIKRDWGWGPEFVQACHKILTSKEIDDYVIASGKTHSLKNVLKEAFLLKNLNYKQFVVSDQRKKRKFDINQNYADIKKIKSKLDWKPRVNLKKIIFRMYNYEY
jgi:GDPmannose 4,6-dehydratase